MISKRYWKYVISGALLLWLAGWLFLGIYRDREFSDKYLFIKHRPTFKFNFYAPAGESDKKPEDLAPENRQEEIMFIEFVEKGGGNWRCIPLP